MLSLEYCIHIIPKKTKTITKIERGLGYVDNVKGLQKTRKDNAETKSCCMQKTMSRNAGEVSQIETLPKEPSDHLVSEHNRNFSKKVSGKK